MFSQIDFQNSIQFKRAVGWERGRAFAVKWAVLKYLKYINAVFWKHPSRLSSRHIRDHFMWKAACFFVSNIETQKQMTLVHVKRCQGEYCSQRKTLISPKWFPILDGYKRYFPKPCLVLREFLETLMARKWEGKSFLEPFIS